VGLLGFPPLCTPLVAVTDLSRPRWKRSSSSKSPPTTSNRRLVTKTVFLHVHGRRCARMCVTLHTPLCDDRVYWHVFGFTLGGGGCDKCAVFNIFFFFFYSASEIVFWVTGKKYARTCALYECTSNERRWKWTRARFFFFFSSLFVFIIIVACHVR
jgi:hypothetical protein